MKGYGNREGDRMDLRMKIINNTEVHICMKKVDQTKMTRKKPWLPWAIAGGCAACFGLGLLIAMALPAGNSNGSSKELAKFEEAYGILKNDWYYAKDDEDIDSRLIEQALGGMTSLEEDRHTNYFSLEQAHAFKDSLAGSNVGIGVSFYPGDDGQMIVKEVYVNSTADRAGIEPGDEIIRVGDKEAGSLSTDELVEYIKSHDGKSLDLQVRRGDETLDLNVTPGTFDSTVSERVIDNVGIIDLSSFSADSGKDFTDAIGRVQKEGVKYLVLDLRNNTGGYLSAAEQIASSFLPDDTTIFIEDLKDGTQKTLKTDKKYAQIDFDHIYILQNGNTASASEVLIGALKDNMPDKVTTIGTNTYGKGTEQVTVPFDDGTSLKYTIAQWLTPNGTSINKVGFKPDVEVMEDEVSTVGYAPLGEEDVLSIGPDTVAPNAAAVQVYLRYLGYPAERSDTYFSLASSEALKQFQSDNGLEPTGIVDNATFEKLLEVVGRRLNADAANDKALNMALEIIRNGGMLPAQENQEASSQDSGQDGESGQGDDENAQSQEEHTIDEQPVE